MTSKRNLRLPVHIVEDHCDALEFILRSIGAKRLNFRNNILIHFDSHPDLLLNTELMETDMFERARLMEMISIETWILPAVFANHISTVVWIKPPWSNQIKAGSYEFKIGVHKETKKVRVSSPLLYFVSALIYSPIEELESCRDFTLHIVSLESFKSDDKVTDLLVHWIGKHEHYILDIDLDFFSTMNPFISMYDKVNMYDKLKHVYEFKLTVGSEVSPLNDSERRKNQIDNLELVFSTLNKNKDCLINDEYLDTLLENIKCNDIKQMLKDLILNLIKEYGSEVDWLMVHDAGTTIDDSSQELPHHPSSKEEIQTYLDTFDDLLKCLPDPKLITIARSSFDEYCRLSDVEFIQEGVCKILRLWKNCDFNNHYLNV